MSCALTAAVDGSEDGQIHCFQEGQPCHAGLERLKFVNGAIFASQENDSFAAITLSDMEEAASKSSLIDIE